MLRIRLDELSAADRERLRAEVAATLLREFSRVPFVDPAQPEPRLVPATQADQARVDEFLAAAWDDQLTYAINAAPLAEHLADLMTRFLLANLPGRTSLRRRALAARERPPQLAASLQRRLVAYVVDGAHPEFGQADPEDSWSRGELVPWERVAGSTTRLATALAAAREEGAAVGSPVAEPVTVALPSVVVPQLSAHEVAQHRTAPLLRPIEEAMRRDMSPQDRAIFVQLREQLMQAMELAATSYGVMYTPQDPAGLLARLRTAGAIDEADLRLAEGILAICGRIAAEGRAGIDDYRQALMLYLLFHRGRFARG